MNVEPGPGPGLGPSEKVKPKSVLIGRKNEEEKRRTEFLLLRLCRLRKYFERAKITLQPAQSLSGFHTCKKVNAFKISCA